MTTIEALLNHSEIDAPVHQVLVGAFWTAVVLDTDPPRCGLASTLRAETHDSGPPVPQAGRLVQHSGRELAGWLRSPRILEASIGMAALNALLDVDEAACTEVNAEDVILRWGTGRRVAIVGHFPFVERVHRAAEVLGGEDLHRTVDGERRPGGVGPGRRLRPAGSGNEVHEVRPAPGRGGPVDPQQSPVRVAHRHQMVAVPGVAPGQLTDQRHRPGQRMVLTKGAESVVVEFDARDALGAHPGPLRSNRLSLFSSIHYSTDKITGSRIKHFLCQPYPDVFRRHNVSFFRTGNHFIILRIGYHSLQL